MPPILCRACALLLLTAAGVWGDWNPSERYLLLTDRPDDDAVLSLQKLYVGQIAVQPVGQAKTAFPCGPQALSQYAKVVVLLFDLNFFEIIPFEVLRGYAKGGRHVVADLAYYARAKGLKTEQYVEKDTDPLNFNSGGPWMEIVAHSDVTSGFAPGSVVPWYGARQVQEGGKQCLVYRQSFIAELHDLGFVRVLGRSSVRKGALLVEEKVGDGRIVAMDLCTLSEPRLVEAAHVWSFDPETMKGVEQFHHFGERYKWLAVKLHQGSFNKYCFLGNVLNRAIEFGQHENCYVPYADIVKRMEAVSAKGTLFRMKKEATQKPNWVELNRRRATCNTANLAAGLHPRWEFGLSPNEPDRFTTNRAYPTYGVYSLTAGDDTRPILLLTHNHGNEWSSVYGHLAFARWLSRHAADEYLAMKLNNYCLKLLPTQNPSGYEFDWGSGSGIEETHDPTGLNAAEPVRQTRNYHIHLRVDFHEQGGGTSMRVGSCYGYGFANALEDRISTELCGMFRNRFLYRGGLGATQLMVQPVRTCRFWDILWTPHRQIFPTEPLCLYQANNEVNTGIPTRYLTRMHSLAVLTEEIARQDYCTVFPRKWAYEELQPRAGGATARLWRWSPDDRGSFRVVSFSQSQSRDGPVPRIDWQRFEVVDRGDVRARLHDSPVTGWKHAEGAAWGCTHAVGGASQDLRWTYMTKPTFCDWHNWVDADFFRPLLKKHLVWFDQNLDGFADTFLLDEDNDGVYDRAIYHDRAAQTLTDIAAGKAFLRKIMPDGGPGILWRSKGEPLGEPSPVQPTVAGLIRRPATGGTEYGWGDLLHTGYSALGTSLAKRLCTGLKDLASPLSAEMLNGCKAIVVTRLDAPLPEADAAALRQYLEQGGRVLVSVTTHDAKKLEQYNRWFRGVGLELTPEVAASYVVVSPRDFCYLQTRRITFEDRSGRDLLPPGGRVMTMSYVIRGGEPWILLNSRPIGARVRIGKGELLVLGGSDLASNETLSDRLNHPLELDQAEYPRPAVNAEVRDRIAAWMVDGPPLAFLKPQVTMPLPAKPDRDRYGFGQETTFGGHQVLTMENRYLKVGLIPKLGGRIVQFVTKRNGHDQFSNWHLKTDLTDIDRMGPIIRGGYTELIGEANQPAFHFTTPAQCTSQTLADRLVLIVEVKRPHVVLTRRMELQKESAELKLTVRARFLTPPAARKPRVGFVVSPNVGGIFRGVEVGDDEKQGFINFLKHKWSAFRTFGIAIPSKLDYRESGLLWSEKEYAYYLLENGALHAQRIDGDLFRKKPPPDGSSPWIVFVDQGHREAVGLRCDPAAFQKTDHAQLAVNDQKYIYTYARHVKPPVTSEAAFTITWFAVDGLGSLTAVGARHLLDINPQDGDGRVAVAVGCTKSLEGASLTVILDDRSSGGEPVSRNLKVPTIGPGASVHLAVTPSKPAARVCAELKDANGRVLVRGSRELPRAAEAPRPAGSSSAGFGRHR